VELGEQDKLEAGRKLARNTFQRFVKRLPRAQRRTYWGQTEVLYRTYYAYEEILCTFADSPGDPTSMLAAMEALSSRLSGEEISFDMEESERLRGRSLFERRDAADTAQASAIARPLVYISYAA